MNIKETIKNIRSKCNNYIDQDLVATIIDDKYSMKSNKILELDEYGIKKEDNFEDRIIKILKYENVFIAIGMYTFVPIINECDIYSTKDYNFKLTQKEFNKYGEEKEKILGILIKKDTNEYIIGHTDLCNCSINSSFREIEPSELEFYKKIEKIVSEKIIK